MITNTGNNIISIILSFVDDNDGRGNADSNANNSNNDTGAVFIDSTTKIEFFLSIKIFVSECDGSFRTSV